jgi:hypothetical protein
MWYGGPSLSAAGWVGEKTDDPGTLTAAFDPDATTVARDATAVSKIR